MVSDLLAQKTLIFHFFQKNVKNARFLIRPIFQNSKNWVFVVFLMTPPFLKGSKIGGPISQICRCILVQQFYKIVVHKRRANHRIKLIAMCTNYRNKNIHILQRMTPVKCEPKLTQSKILMFFKQAPPHNAQIHNEKDCDEDDQTVVTNRLPIVSKQLAQVTPIYECDVYFDGCSKGNPGPSGAGAVIYHNGKEVWSDCSYVGDKETNNYAEYQGLLLGLKAAKTLNVTHLNVFGDSKLVISHMLGNYQVKSEKMLSCYKQCKQQTKQFAHIDFHHVYRNKNERADQLSNEGLLKA